MKVLLINVNCKSGSTGKITYDLYSELIKDGHEAAICYGRGSLIEEPNIIKISTDIEMYIHAFLTRITGLNGYFSPFATNRLLKFIKEFKPDVVHIHELKTYYVNIGSIMKHLKENNIKTIWTLHSEFMYTGKCGHSYNCKKWMTQCGECPNLRGYPKSLIFDFTKKMFSDKKNYFSGFEHLDIVSPSQWLADRIRQSFLKEKNINVIHNGIDISIFHPTDTTSIKQKYSLEQKKVVLVVAPGLMSKHKGGDWVLEIAKKFKTEPIVFILIGISDLTRKFDDNIVALGRTEDQYELAAFYSLADLFVICSERENFPTVCIEALACGTPIIGFDTGGTKETAPEGYGIFVPYGDIKKMTSMIGLALKNKTNLKSKAECAKFGQDSYSKSVMYYKYLHLYKE